MHKLNHSNQITLALMLLTVLVVWGIRTQRLNTSPVEARLENGNSSLDDVKIYAQNMGIGLEEAERQFHLQDAAGELQIKLRENEADTFAAIWIEHTPEFKIVVLFTENAQQKIKPYLTEELTGVVEARDVKTSLAMLEDSQEKVISSLLNLGIQARSETDVYENRITIFVNETDKSQLDAALQNKQITLPNNVDVVTVWKLEQTGEAANPPSLGDHFPQLLSTPNVFVDLPPVQGELVLENGCLRLSGVNNRSTGSSYLLIWDARFSTRTEQGVVRVIDSITNEVLASVGDHVMVGDGGDIIGRTWKPIPEECPGPYLVVGESVWKIDRP